MQEIKKRTIVIASVLKPVDDTRMYEKFGRSLQEAGVKVVIVGYPVTSPPQDIQIISLSPFKRLGLRRIFIGWSVLKKITAAKPTDLIVCTHELLLCAVLARILSGVRITYDIRENYYRNILFLNTFNIIVRWPLAMFVRLKERILTPFFHHFLLAERNYASELSFLPRSKCTIIENKAIHQGSDYPKKRGKHTLLFTGTLSESAGVFSAIHLTAKLHALDPNITLTIVGYSPKHAIYQRLIEEISTRPFITLIGGNHLIPHPVIQEAIRQADFGLILYEDSPAHRQSVPTKLFEYFADRLPIIAYYHPLVAEMVSQAKAGFIVGSDEDPSLLLKHLQSGTFYHGTLPSTDWKDEKPRFLKALKI